MDRLHCNITITTVCQDLRLEPVRTNWSCGRRWLDRWLDKRKGFAGSSTVPLFCTLGGEKLATTYVRALLRRLKRKTGIQKRVHPHGLRHTHASELLREGTNIGEISRQLGHSSIATTDRYLNHINPQQGIDTMRKRTWDAPL
jgi:site-specific recombinase XerD